MTESTFDILKSQLKPRLREYIASKGVTISQNGMMRCLNPNHTDTNASMKILADLNEEQVWCYGCSTTGDIFTVAHWLDKAPLNGMEFIQNNVLKLAQQFSIPYEDISLAPEQVEKIEWYRFISIVVDRMQLKDEHGKPINWTTEHCEKRGWKPETCEKLGIATVQNYNKFIKQLQHITGYSTEEIKAKGITADIFGPDYITITIFDERGRPCGFTARNLNWVAGSGIQKYKNSQRSPIYQKGDILYGMNFIRAYRSRRLDIFEGNGSFVVAFGHGHNSCVALCGSSLTESQVQLIRTLGFTHINLVLDNDDTGKAKTDEYMQKLSGIEGLKVEATTLVFKPEDSNLKDPEDYILKYGLSEFYKLRPKSAFDWYIEKEAEPLRQKLISGEDFCNKMVKVLFNTENRIERGRQRAKLSELTGVPDRDIEAEMERQTRSSVFEIKNTLNKKIAGARTADEISEILFEGQGKLSDTVSARETTNTLSIEESIQSFTDLVTILESKKPGLQGWATRFDVLDRKISGIPKPVGYDQDENIIPVAGTLVGFPGVPQMGKSTVIQNIALNIARFNDDCTIQYWALDDSRQRVIERMLAMLSGISWRKVTRRDPMNNAERVIYAESVEIMKGLIADGKLIFKDHSAGSTIPILMKWVEMMQDKFQRPTLVIIDSFHKIHPSESDNGRTEHSTTKAFCQKLKSFAQTHHVSIMASIEMTKAQQRGVEPDLLHMAEARKLEYDFDILATVYNHYYDMDGQSEQVLKTASGEIEPLIKVNFRKSKDGGSGPMYFALNQSNFKLQDYSLSDITDMTGLEPIGKIGAKDIDIVPPDIGGLKSNKNWPLATMKQEIIKPEMINTVTGEVTEPWNIKI